jgi:hypothetical protein
MLFSTQWIRFRSQSTSLKGTTTCAKCSPGPRQEHRLLNLQEKTCSPKDQEFAHLSWQTCAPCPTRTPRHRILIWLAAFSQVVLECSGSSLLRCSGRRFQGGPIPQCCAALSTPGFRLTGNDPAIDGFVLLAPSEQAHCLHVSSTTLPFHPFVK